MSTFISFPDGRLWWAANWVYDTIVERIADDLVCGPAEEALASWLRGRLCTVQGPGVGCVDLRELSEEDRRLFRAAAQSALRQAILSGPIGWHDPSFFPVWLKKFRQLLRMWKAADRREPFDQ